jgi:hypothetical protein
MSKKLLDKRLKFPFNMTKFFLKGSNYHEIHSYTVYHSKLLVALANL